MRLIRLLPAARAERFRMRMPLKEKIKHGKMLVMDFGCRCKGYHSDMTRTSCRSESRPLQCGRFMPWIMEARRKKALDMLKAGAAGPYDRYGGA